MADLNEKVMDAVKKEMEKDPSISIEELKAKATKIDPSIANLTARQFNARYPLQIKRAASAAQGGGTRRRRRSRRTEVNREALRGILLELAQDVAKAEGKGDIIEVVTGIDKYVDRVVQTTSKR